MSTPAELSGVVFDCADPGALAEFYQAVTGWVVTYRDDESVQLDGGAGLTIGFQRITDYVGPGWPSAAKHAHLDLRVQDLQRAVTRILALGAAMPEFQPGGDAWIVLTDPAGHPFCLVRAD